MACTPPPAWGVKILEKSLQGGVRKFYFGRGGRYIVGGLRNLEVKIKIA